MDNQIILVADKDGSFTGEYIPKEIGHTGDGKRHLAITVLLYNNHNQVLLQQRKHKVFDDIWDFTGATHPLHNNLGDEDFIQASKRCLMEEWGINGEVKLKNLGSFNYFAKYGDLCENEHCAVVTGEFSGNNFTLNEADGYGYKWMDKQAFLEDIKKNPQNYSPWAIEGVKILEKNNFFK